MVEEVVMWTEDETINATGTTDGEVDMRAEDGTIIRTGKNTIKDITASRTETDMIENTTAGSIRNVSIGEATNMTEGARRVEQESRIVRTITNRVKRRFHPHHRLNQRTIKKVHASTSTLENASQRSLQIMAENP